jgi:hypothetical protein
LYASLQRHKELGNHILIERGDDYHEGFYLSPSIITLEEIISNINSIIEKFN